MNNGTESIDLCKLVSSRAQSGRPGFSGPGNGMPVLERGMSLAMVCRLGIVLCAKKVLF